MFLSKRGSGFYYRFFFDDLGRRHGVSTHTKLKSEVLKFLQDFRENKQVVKTNSTFFSRFIEEYLNCSQTIRRPKATESARTALREFLKRHGAGEWYARTSPALWRNLVFWNFFPRILLKDNSRLLSAPWRIRIIVTKSRETE